MMVQAVARFEAEPPNLTQVRSCRTTMGHTALPSWLAVGIPSSLTCSDGFIMQDSQAMAR